MPNHNIQHNPPPIPVADTQQGRSKLHKLKRQAFVVIGPSIAYVPLTRGQFACVEVGDLALVSPFNWYAQWNAGTQSFYAFREVYGRKKIGMHGFLLHPGKNLVPDHINGVTLDNRLRGNLRPATTRENAHNARLRCDNKTGYRGVSPVGDAFEARVRVGNRRIYLGTFSTAQQADDAIRTLTATNEFRRAA